MLRSRMEESSGLGKTGHRDLRESLDCGLEEVDVGVGVSGIGR
jgi:hypothetical protein